MYAAERQGNRQDIDMYRYSSNM